MTHLDIICDGPVAQSLGVEAADPAILKRPPRNKDESIISKALIRRVMTSALIIVFGSLLIFFMYLEDGAASDKSRTMV